jgi:Protein of unknown function (DUF3300)
MSKRNLLQGWAFVFAAAGFIVGPVLSVAAGDDPVANGEPQAIGASGDAQAKGPSSTPSPAPLSHAQLDQLTAPIALYPDPLLGSILAAATYPLEIVEAARWLDDPAHATLRGEQLTAALQAEPWDASVKALVAFPDVLRMMNENLQWMEQLGDAFLAQQGDVMDSIQRLRGNAVASGALQSTPQQTVGSEGQDVTIEPAAPDVVYVPYYSPLVVYGSWPWPEYPPFYFAPPLGVFYAGAIGFGIGIGIVGAPWGGYGWNWPTHALIVPHRGPRQPRLSQWTHDPAHRAGVPYRDAAVAQRFLGPGANFRPSFRGYAPEAPHAPQAPHFPPSQAGGALPPRASLPQGSPPVRGGAEPHLSPGPNISPRASAPAIVPRAPPVFESFGRGPQVRGNAARGFSSHSAPRAAPSAPARPSSGGPAGGRRR